MHANDRADASDSGVQSGAGAAKVMLPEEEKGAGLQPNKLLWAADLRDTRFAFTNPVAMK